MAPWSIVAAMVAWAMVAPGLQAQEADSLPVVAAQDGSQVSVLAGMRIDLGGVPSPGASLEVMADSPIRHIWMSLQFLAQMTRWNVQYDSMTRRDHGYLGRVRAGLGTGAGPSIYVLFEHGIGIIKADRERLLGQTYEMTGVGLGVGLTVGRVTGSLEFVLGGADRADPDLYGGLGLSLQYRLPRIF
ncbi:hypothetical protein [Candidatus Palauibacter sp.]|uniref:hypothetical protein n=1 Tax=Candidatus Palauibacter sp. TaxID=3101350 RepID=UPI003B0234B4